MAKLLLLTLLAVAISADAASVRVKRQGIPREFQNINIENYFKNKRAVMFQLKCVIYDGPCDRIGKYLKITIPELLTNQCRNCNPEQRKQAGRIVAYIQQNYPKEWDDAVKKYQGGKVISADEIKRFEEQFGVKAVGVATEASEGAVPYTGPPTTTEKISLAEIGQIVRDAQKEFNSKSEQEQKELLAKARGQ